MGVSIVVGGQFGSEGKGKVARWFAKEKQVSTVVRVGGTNSGHTVIDADGRPAVFRILPTAAIDKEVNCVLPAGSYIDIDVLFREIQAAGISSEKIKIHPNAAIITEEQKQMERDSGLVDDIGSTGSGTGAAVSMRAMRDHRFVRAKDIGELSRFIFDTGEFLRQEISDGREVLIEGTQGFGLSNLHSQYYPKATSRDTSAAGFLSEAGLSPFDVAHIIMVIRAYPIRVAGKESGPLPNELTWDDVTALAQKEDPIREYTSVTNHLRRVGKFDPDVVLRAIRANRPDQIVLNHLDYIPGADGVITPERAAFIDSVQRQINAKINYVGMDRKTLYST